MTNPQTSFLKGRNIVWFSCGAASAVTLKMVSEELPVTALYCDTSPNEHSDNARFLADIEKWTGVKIERLRSKEFPSMDIYDVFEKVRFLKSPQGAPCTKHLKRYVREANQYFEDVHFFGFTSDESDRIADFELDNPSLNCRWILQEQNISKADCFRILKDAGIKLPAMYRMGYRNNNCIGCVKGGAGYWNKIRKDFPDVFNRMAALERKLNFSLLGCFLDELKPTAGRYKSEPDISCGPQCKMDQAK